MDLTHKKLLVISPHPDDEVLGCAGLIQKVKKGGGKVYILYLTVGDTRDFSEKGSSTKSERLREIDKVAKYLKVDKFHIGFPGDKYHLKLDAHGQHEVMKLVERDSPVSVEKIKPDMVVFPSLYSYNQDHTLTAKAIHAALRPTEFNSKHFVKNVFAFEVPADGWSLYEQRVPNLFLSLTKSEMNVKIHALKLYESQYRPHPNPRSAEAVEALALFRGTHTMSKYAEAFHIIRIAYV